jgi:hypothetical protein
VGFDEIPVLWSVCYCCRARVLALVAYVPIDPSDWPTTKELIPSPRQVRKPVIFPAGRLALDRPSQNVCQRPGLVADQLAAIVLPSCRQPLQC